MIPLILNGAGSRAQVVEIENQPVNGAVPISDSDIEWKAALARGYLTARTQRELELLGFSPPNHRETHMPIYTDGREADISRPSHYCILTGRGHPTTPATRPATHITHHMPTCAAWRCRAAACDAHVAAPGGAQQRLCARHWREARERERVEIARRQLAALFGACRPRVTRSGGASTHWTIRPVTAPATQRYEGRAA